MKNDDFQNALELVRNAFTTLAEDGGGYPEHVIHIEGPCVIIAGVDDNGGPEVEIIPIAEFHALARLMLVYVGLDGYDEVDAYFEAHARVIENADTYRH